MQRAIRLSIIVIALLVSSRNATIHADEPPPAISNEHREFFEEQVRPLLVKRCFDCHGGTKSSGGLSLETASGWQKGGESGPAIVPGSPEQSLLLDAINYRSLEMPPADKGGKLPDGEIAVLTKWIAMGAPDPRDGSDRIGGMDRETAKSWWAFQPLPEVDADLDPMSAAKHVDKLIDRELTQRGLTAAPRADDRTLLRRLSYDLTGLPPATLEADTWNDTIERLLASPQYGVHWGRHWLDVVRYADTAGENTDRPLPHAWRYRNWVFESFNRDRPFDEFVRMQIAGDVLNADAGGVERTDGIIATGYLAIARRFGHDIDKDMYLTHEDVIDNLGKNFLGLTLGCARCHDHKYDPVSADDYYALYGIFQSTRFAFPGCEPKGQPRDLVPLLETAEVERLNTAYQQTLAAFEQREQLAKTRSTELQQPMQAASRVLAESQVDEGASVALNETALSDVSLRAGEVLLLTVSPNGNHGADTTRVELVVTQASTGQAWNIHDVIDQFTAAGPLIAVSGSAWCLLDVTNGPAFLRDRKESINGVAGLNGWSSGDTPSAIVTSGSDPVDVWTRLPARSVFIHPGPDRNVAVAWVCPADGIYRVEGSVSDAHPAPGLDGVRFTLEHVAVRDMAKELATLAERTIGKQAARPEPPSMPMAYAVIDSTAANTRLHERGDPEKLGDEIPRRWLTVFGGAPVHSADRSGRAELAEWVTDHPLFARVMVNRIWEWHFGRGLVRSSNDFGSRGELPTHPELLDYLAAKFVQSGYSVKAMHRIILQTNAWQRSSSAPTADDPDNRWLAHFTRRRLTAEELRDSLLTVSGQLDLTAAEGHPFPPESSWTFTQHAPFNAVYDTNRRSAYLMVQRQRRHPFLALFDGADPNASTPSRQTTTVPTQALYFINDPFFHEQAAEVARRVLLNTGDDERLRDMSRIVLQREFSEVELDRFKSFVEQYVGNESESWSAMSRVLLASNEFLFVE